MRRPEASFTSPQSTAAAVELGSAVRQARLGRNLTQADFAQRARISLATLQRIERGDPAVSFTSWLSAMETGALLGALRKAAAPEADALGSAQRQSEQRRRAAKPKRKDGATPDTPDAYDF
jgi:transcriptional regulator with XRE-family HTH domain